MCFYVGPMFPTTLLDRLQKHPGAGPPQAPKTRPQMVQRGATFGRNGNTSTPAESGKHPDVHQFCHNLDNAESKLSATQANVGGPAELGRIREHVSPTQIGQRLANMCSMLPTWVQIRATVAEHRRMEGQLGRNKEACERHSNGARSAGSDQLPNRNGYKTGGRLSTSRPDPPDRVRMSTNRFRGRRRRI